ncbi:MAG: S-layer homology domain-containing protein [Butyricicoccaceae bacterium]
MFSIYFPIFTCHLKKVLALVLAFACAFTMFASAAFTDQADIKATDAVDMLVALGVVDGFEDGSFQPNGTVTRAQMAKMIYVLRTGKSDASAYNNDKTSFTDINSHWAAGYIKYCQSLGIIAGKSNTKFDPNGKVTAQEAAKMLLVTLGYNAEKAGLVGSNWASKTNALADENGLLKDVNTSFTAACPRQYAAQLIYNTVFAPTVVWRDDAYQHTNVLDKDNQTVGEKYMNLVKETAGVLYACSEVEGKDYYTISTSAGQKTYNKVPTDVSELLGQNVKVLVKHDNNGNYDKAYGVYADEDSKILATGFVSGLETDGDKIKLDGTSYKFDNGYSLDTTLVYDTNKDTNAVSLRSLANAADKTVVTPTVAASKIKLIDNDGNGKVDSAVKTPVQVAKVTSVSKTSFSVKYLTAGVSNKTIDFDDAEVYDGIKKDDFVTIIDDANRASDKSLVEKLDVVSTKVTSTRTNEAKATGTDWYKLAVAKDGRVSVTSGNEYDLVIVGGVIVDADETAASTSTVAYIADVKDKAETTLGSKDITWKVGIYFQDGTNDEVKVSKIGGTKLKDVASYATVMAGMKQKLVTYSKLSDGTYDIKLVGDNNKVGMDWTAKVAASTSSKNTNKDVYAVQKIGNKSVADDAYVFVDTAKEVKVLTGKQINNWSDEVKLAFTSNGMLTKDSNGIAYVKFATLISKADEKVPGASKDTLYAYVVSDAYKTDVDGEDKAAYDVWTGTEVKTLIEDASAPSVSAVAGDVISYSENGNYADEIKKVGTEAAITGYDKNNVTYRVDNTKNNVYTYELDDDCVFIAMNDDKNTGMEGSKDAVTTANEKTVSGVDYYVTNAYIVLNDDGDKIIAIVYDADDSKLDPENLFVK